MSDLVPYPGPSQPQPRIVIQPAQDPNWERREAVREHIRHLAFLLDSAFQIPGTKIRVGLDPLLGLIPVVGDFIGLLAGGYIVMLAAGLGVPRVVLARMWLNLAIDAVLGAIPILGDVLDAAWRAHAKNATLLDRALTDPHATARSSTWVLIGLILALIAITVGGIALAVWLIGLLVQAVQ
jgi:hypothetical protein